MRVFCEHQESHPDTYCHYCGQGFSLYWEDQSPQEQAETLAEVERTMRRHHLFFRGRDAHPEHGFAVQPRNRRRQMNSILSNPALRAA